MISATHTSVHFQGCPVHLPASPLHTPILVTRTSEAILYSFLTAPPAPCPVLRDRQPPSGCKPTEWVCAGGWLDILRQTWSKDFMPRLFLGPDLLKSHSEPPVEASAAHCSG